MKLILTLFCVFSLAFAHHANADQGCACNVPNELLAVAVKMPFPPETPEDTNHNCHQKPCGSTSHNFCSTQFAVDLDVPGTSDQVVACIDGIAYTHDTPSNCIGRHIKIALRDGTYFVYGHLDQITVSNKTYVRQGQILGYAGNTGTPACTSGAHLHFDRLYGDVTEPGLSGDISVPWLVWARNMTSDPPDSSFILYNPADFVCGDPGGDSYDSNNNPNCNSPAQDLDCDYWAFEHWQEMLNRGIFNGVVCGTSNPCTNPETQTCCVLPEDPILRGQLAKVAVLGMCIDIVTNPRPGYPFVDVPEGHQFYPYVVTLWHHYAVQGCDATHFCPNSPALRPEIVKILINTANLRDDVDIALQACTGDVFTDIPTTHSLCQYVEAGAREGILNGYEDGNFGVTNNGTRSEIAKIIDKLINTYDIPVCQ